MIIFLPARNTELLDLNTFLHIPEHQQILIIELWLWEKQIVQVPPQGFINYMITIFNA